MFTRSDDPETALEELPTERGGFGEIQLASERM
jgi:hypothetical protein